MKNEGYSYRTRTRRLNKDDNRVQHARAEIDRSRNLCRWIGQDVLSRSMLLSASLMSCCKDCSKSHLATHHSIIGFWCAFQREDFIDRTPERTLNDNVSCESVPAGQPTTDLRPKMNKVGGTSSARICYAVACIGTSVSAVLYRTIPVIFRMLDNSDSEI